MKDKEKRCEDCVHDREHKKAIQEGKRGSAICMLECNPNHICFEPIIKTKDEEMAKEYVKKEGFRFGMFGELDNITSSEANKEIEQAFLAGLKAGRPQWHDLGKDPNDLPKDNNEVLVYMWDSYYIGYFNLDSWHFENFSEGKEQADAWCETPTFDKE